VNVELKKRYLEELGIDAELVKLVCGSQSTSEDKQSIIIVEDISYANSINSSGSERDLFKKMMAAINISLDNVLIQSMDKDQLKDNISKLDTNLTLLVGSFSNNEELLSIPHPEEIKKDEQLKRVAWETLKKFQKQIVANTH
jgi:hypothetical protein